MADNSAFFAELDQVLQTFTGELADVAVNIAEQIISDVVDGNPVDTGRSASDWVLSLGSPILQVSEHIHPSSKVTHAEAKQTSLATVQNIKNMKYDDVVYLANGNFYVEWLEEGNGPNGPKWYNGYIRLALAKWEGIVDYTLTYE